MEFLAPTLIIIIGCLGVIASDLHDNHKED